MRINLNALIFALLLLGAVILKVRSQEVRQPASLKEVVHPIPEEACLKTKHPEACKGLGLLKKMPPGGRSKPEAP